MHGLSLNLILHLIPALIFFGLITWRLIWLAKQDRIEARKRIVEDYERLTRERFERRLNARTIRNQHRVDEPLQ